MFINKTAHYTSMTWWSKIGKGSVSVISSDHLCKDGHARFTTIPFIALSDQEINVYNLKTNYFFIVASLQNLFVHLNCRKTKKSYHNLSRLNLEKRRYLTYYWSDKGFKGTVWIGHCHMKGHLKLQSHEG